MRISSWFPGMSCGSSRRAPLDPGGTLRPRALGLGLASALALVSAVASAQPRPAQPPAGRAAQPPAAAPGQQPAAAPGQPPAAAPGQPPAAAPGQQPAAAPGQPPAAAPGQPPAAAPGQPPAGAAPPAAPGAEPAQPDEEEGEEEEPLLPTQPAPVAAPPAGAAAPPAVAAPEAARSGGSPEIGARPSDVYAEDWWTHARPTFEIHGIYRLRAELFHQFALGRREPLGEALLWAQPPDKGYIDLEGTPNPVLLCGDDPTSPETCDNNTQSGANMRFRVNPELHVSDNLRVLAQIDMLDNLVLGSTAEGYGGYQLQGRGGYTPLGVFSNTQWVPYEGQGSQADSVVVKRVWGEYLTPVGLLRFGRMPQHWGLGMLWNSGDGHDSDWQTTVDRLMLVTGIKKYDLYFAAAWDFANEGLTRWSYPQQQGQAYDAASEDDVNQYVLVAVRRKNPELQKLELARGNVVMNGGVHFTYRTQSLANDTSDDDTAALTTQDDEDLRQNWVRRGAEMYIPDVWFQLLYKKFRFELEAAAILGSIENTATTGSNYQNLLNDDDNGWGIRQFGITTQAEYRAIEDRLRVQFNFGYATGDDDVSSLAPPAQGGGGGLQPQLTSDRTYSTFRFHPDYRVDLILWRNILQRVQGAYYFRPSVEYDFARDKNGQRLGGGAAVIWSRAAEFVQTPGHARDLGLELNATLYYQSKDGTLNDDPDRMGGFFTMVQYGVMFPLGGLGYLPGEQLRYQNATGLEDLDTETAQIVRWYLGVLF